VLSAPPTNDSSIHRRAGGTQSVSIRYSECLQQAGIALSVGHSGDSYGNGLADGIDALYETEVIDPRGACSCA